MFQKYYYYDILISTRPDGSDMKFEQGVLPVPFWWSPKDAMDQAIAYVKTEYEVNYGFHFKEFRRIK